MSFWNPVPEKKWQVHPGQVFGRLTVEGSLVYDERSRQTAVCKCICGKTVPVATSMLLSGRAKSCGCLQREGVVSRFTKHSDSPSSGKILLNGTWVRMRHRCSSSIGPDAKNYHDKGIRVCDEWNSYKIFREWALANGYKPGLSIDRIDPDGNYEPGNCQWITVAENSEKMHRDRDAKFARLEQQNSDFQALAVVLMLTLATATRG